MLRQVLQSKHSFHAKNICSFNGVAHDPANPNFYIDVTADFNLSITGTLMVNAGLMAMNRFITVNKLITGAGATIQVYFIHGIRFKMVS
jgi:hypothetical protein